MIRNTRKSALSIIPLLCLFLGSFANAEQASDPLSEISVEALRETLTDRGWAVVDVRGQGGWVDERYGEAPEPFASGHIPGALPLGTELLLNAEGQGLTSEALAELVATLGPRASTTVRPKTVTFVLYGDDGDDPRPETAARQLQGAGFEARVLAGGWAAWRASGGPRLRLVDAPAAEALGQREDVVTVDLREAWDFADGALPRAVSIPLRLLPERLEGAVAQPPSFDPASSPLLFYCYGIDCIRSQQAAIWSAQRGYGELVWFRGGIDAWEAEGYDLVVVEAPEDHR